MAQGDFDVLRKEGNRSFFEYAGATRSVERILHPFVIEKTEFIHKRGDPGVA
jgi:hypothetical protein